MIGILQINKLNIILFQVTVPVTTAEPETNACEALLQLAGGGVHHAISQPAASGDTTRYV